MKILAIILLLVEVLLSAISGFAGLYMTEGSYIGVSLFIFLPTAIVPVSYFLYFHAINAHDKEQIAIGVSSAVKIFFANAVIVTIGESILYSLAKSEYFSDDLGYQMALILFCMTMIVTQWFSFLHYREKVVVYSSKLE